MFGIESSALPPLVRDLISHQPRGHSLLGKFYSDPTIYALDLDRVWRKGWLFAGHSCEIPNAGDYFKLNVDTDSILVVRGQNGEFHAVHNVCRHRGSTICDSECGH